METKLWEIYNYIKERSKRGMTTTVADICEMFSNYYSLNQKECNYSNCPALYKDIDKINASDEIEKIIIKDNNNFHIGTKEQCINYAEKLRSQALKQLKKYWRIERKIQRNGNGKILTAKLKPIDEHSKARTFVESFIDDLIAEEAE